MEPQVGLSEEVPDNATVVRSEEVPDNATVVRFLRNHEIDEAFGQIVASTHAFLDRELSVDWLQKTCLDDGYARLPKSVAHAIFEVYKLRSMKETVQYDPNDLNPAHTLVIAKEQKRSKATLLLYIHFALEIARRPAPVVSASVPESRALGPDPVDSTST